MAVVYCGREILELFSISLLGNTFHDVLETGIYSYSVLQLFFIICMLYGSAFFRIAKIFSFLDRLRGRNEWRNNVFVLKYKKKEIKYFVENLKDKPGVMNIVPAWRHMRPRAKLYPPILIWNSDYHGDFYITQCFYKKNFTYLFIFYIIWMIY